MHNHRKTAILSICNHSIHLLSNVSTISFDKKYSIMKLILPRVVYTLTLMIFFLRFLFCLAILYLLSIFLAANMNRLGSVCER